MNGAMRERRAPRLNRGGRSLSGLRPRPIPSSVSRPHWTPITRLGALTLTLVGGLASSGCDNASAYEQLSGAQIYERLCTQCHGPEGRALHGRGGSYLGKRKYWTRATLLEYLEDPQAYKRKAPHLSSAKYMPPLTPYVQGEARARLVDHVLGLMDALEPSKR